MTLAGTSGTTDGSRALRPRFEASHPAFRRKVQCDGPDAVITYWDGMAKGFGTRTLYTVAFGAGTALLAMIAVVTFGFDAAILVIVTCGLGLGTLVAFLAPPAWCERVPAEEIRVGDLVAAGDDDFVLRAAPVTAVTVAMRGSERVFQIATAAGSAFEAPPGGSLATVRFVGFEPRRPRQAMSAAAAAAAGAGAGVASGWPWADIVGDLVGWMLQHRANGGSELTRDQIRGDLMDRLRCRRATARYALVAAMGLGFVTRGRAVIVTPAGAVWFASRAARLGSRIENPGWCEPVISVTQSPSEAVWLAGRPAPDHAIVDLSDSVPDLARREGF